MAKTQNTRRKAGKPTDFPPETLRKFHDRLSAWYGVHGRRDLPWRNTDDAYAIWVSEVMLQQTQVKTVLERYYTPFLKQFPSIEALADALPDTLMKAWEGLGYYSRARNLQKAAQHIMLSSLTKRGDPDWIAASPKAPRNDGIAMPDKLENLIALSGIGRNTAHAILVFAYHKPVAVMEANVKRVLCRVFALTSPHDEQLWELAHTMVNRDAPFEYNQAMMDIGATVCTKTQPKCGECPVAILCKGKDEPTAYPARKIKKKTPIRTCVITALRDASGRYFLAPRRTQFLHGLYGFIASDDALPRALPKGRAYKLGNITQVYSHFTLNADVLVYEIQKAAPRFNDGGYYTLAEIEALPLSRADAKVLALLQAYEMTRGASARRKKK